jgi:hypothetical protein
MRKIHWFYAVIACLACMAAVGLYLLVGPGHGSTGQQLVPVFHGLVTDAQGQPLEGAEVDVVTSQLAVNPMTGGVLKGKSKLQQFVVVSGRDGRFSFRLQGGRNVIQIRGVSKPGFSWVFDWLWDSGVKYSRFSNMEFVLQGYLWEGGGYFPDPANPAIFPMCRPSDTELTQYPSRGGTDPNPSTGKYEPNVPVKPCVPSTGPGSPGTDSTSIGRAIEQYHRDHTPK